MKKIISALLLICILTLSLASCGVSKDKLIGMWRGEWEYNGNDIISVFELKEDGTYTEITFKRSAHATDYSISSTENGTYEIKGKKVRLSDAPGSATEFTYKNGKLENGGHYYEQVED